MANDFTRPLKLFRILPGGLRIGSRANSLPSLTSVQRAYDSSAARCRDARMDCGRDTAACFVSLAHPHVPFSCGVISHRLLDREGKGAPFTDRVLRVPSPISSPAGCELLLSSRAITVMLWHWRVAMGSLIAEAKSLQCGRRSDSAQIFSHSCLWTGVWT